MCPTRDLAGGGTSRTSQDQAASTNPEIATDMGQDGQDPQNWCELIRFFVYQTSHFEDTL